ncbi:hypothetical protein RJT34_21575 [Clitoria ternatea]|uniref:Uncharacterized protein n=1 Tax=Clitoria ternatea TaxID=43366 RepID=A0AAN9IUI6_CLITE
MERGSSSLKTLKIQNLLFLNKPKSYINPSEFTHVGEKHNSNLDATVQIDGNNEEIIVEERQEFSFAHIDPLGTLVFADEIFDNGQIQPAFATCDKSLTFATTYENEILALRSPLKKLFVEQAPQHNSFSKESKVSSNEKLLMKMSTKIEMLNDRCKKSKSIGFSKIMRYRKDLKLRSNSDGNDVFVSLNPLTLMQLESNEKVNENVVSKDGKCRKKKSALSTHEKFYVKNKERKQSRKHKSFLPYRQELIGFFTNVHGLSRNIHPF